MNNTKNSKLLCCILGSFMLTLLQTPFFYQATYTMFGGSYGFNLFTEALYKILGIISFVGVIMVTVFSCALIMNNIKFKDK